MTIAFFITAISNSGGMERVSICIANELAKNPDNQIYFISRVSGTPFFHLSDKVHFISLSSKQSENLYLNWFKYVWEVAYLVKSLKIEKWIDVGSNMSLISVPAKLISNFDLITWEHFNLQYVWNSITTPVARWLACHFAEKVVVLTETDRLRYEERYKTGNVICIPNPITSKGIKSNHPKEKIVLTIGRLTYQKGYDMLLLIWKKTQCRHNGWRLVVIGGGELRTELEDKIIELGLEESVYLLNPTKDVETWYAKAEMFVMSSRWEGLPLVLIEALSFGLPIISFDCETGPREIVEGGMNGYLVKPFDIDDFCMKVDLLCDSGALRDSMAAFSLKKSKDFAIDNVIKHWYKCLKD